MKKETQRERSVSDFEREYRANCVKHLIVTALIALAVIAVSVLLAVASKRMGVRHPIIVVAILSPLILHLLVPRVMRHVEEFGHLGALKSEHYDYAAWMEMQSARKITEGDRHLAVKLYREYAPCPAPQQLQTVLNGELKNGRHPVTVSVLCGLLFACEDFHDGDYLSHAKGAFGTAGSMVFEPWVRVLAGNARPLDPDRETLVRQFHIYWIDVCKRADKAS